MDGPASDISQADRASLIIYTANKAMHCSHDQWYKMLYNSSVTSSSLCILAISGLPGEEVPNRDLPPLGRLPSSAAALPEQRPPAIRLNLAQYALLLC